MKHNKYNNNYYPKYYLALKSQDHEKWKDKWQSMLWGLKAKYSHIDWDAFPNVSPEDSGKFFRATSNNHLLVKATESEIINSKVWFLPGTVTAGRDFMLRDLKFVLEGLRDSVSQSQTLIFASYISNKQRYAEAMHYGLNVKNYFSYSIEKFVREYFIPRILKNPSLIFITHSVGGKEIFMIENAARVILINEYKFTIEKVKKIFKCVKAILFGNAPNICRKNSISFGKIIILSASDQGLLIPGKLYDILYKKKNTEKKYTIIHYDTNELIVFLGHDSSIESFNNQINGDGHRLPHYIESIKRLPQPVFSMLKEYIFDEIKTNTSCIS